MRSAARFADYFGLAEGGGPKYRCVAKSSFGKRSPTTLVLGGGGRATNNGRFLAVSKKSTVTARRKGDPQHMLRE